MLVKLTPDLVMIVSAKALNNVTMTAALIFIAIKLHKVDHQILRGLKLKN